MEYTRQGGIKKGLTIKVGTTVSVTRLAGMLGAPVDAVIRKLAGHGVVAGPDDMITTGTASYIASGYGYATIFSNTATKEDNNG